MTWNILCIRCTNGTVGPLAKTKRDLSKKEQRRLVRRFRTDADFAGAVVLPDSRIRYTEQELRQLPTI